MPQNTNLGVLMKVLASLVLIFAASAANASMYRCYTSDGGRKFNPEFDRLQNLDVTSEGASLGVISPGVTGTIVEIKGQVMMVVRKIAKGGRGQILADVTAKSGSISLDVAKGSKTLTVACKKLDE
jgi:hypothetical protein